MQGQPANRRDVVEPELLSKGVLSLSPQKLTAPGSACLVLARVLVVQSKVWHVQCNKLRCACAAWPSSGRNQKRSLQTVNLLTGCAVTELVDNSGQSTADLCSAKQLCNLANQ